MTVEARKRTEKSNTVFLIGLFKLFKGVLLIAVALGTFGLVHKDLDTTLRHWAHELHVDPNGRRAQMVMAKLTGVTPKKLKAVGAAEIFYSGLLLTEGIGLLLRRRWAEYFTVISTAVFIPLEIYELTERVSFTRFAVLAINVAIVWYLAQRLRSTR